MKVLKFIDPNIKLKKLDDLIIPPKIVLVNSFNESAAKTFREEMEEAENTGQTVIPVVIDSYGGEVYSLLSMADTIKNSTLPVATIISGKAMSCGAILFSFGAEGMRYAAPHSTIMIHDVSSGNWGKVEEIKADAKETERLNELLYEMMSLNCGKAPSYFKDIVHQKGHADWFFTAEEAKKHNFVNHISVPSLKVNVEVKYEWA